MTDAITAPPEEAVGPLVRGLAVVRALAVARGRRGVSDLVRDTGLARSTVDRVLHTLAVLGHLRQEGRDAVLTPALMELGNAYLAASRLPALLGPLADRLAGELDESVSLAVPDRDGTRFVHQVTRRRAMSVAFHVGDLIPAESGAPGALFAAGWTEDDRRRWRLRRSADPGDAAFPVLPGGVERAAASFEQRIAAAGRDGWSLDDQLIEPGLVAIAMPVRDGAGHDVCAVSVVSHTSRHSAASLRDAVLPRLRETVTAMEAALSTAGPYSGPVGTTSPAVSSSGAAGGASFGVPSSGAVAAVPAGSPAHAEKRGGGPEFVESFARGLRVLTAFGEAGPQAPLTALAEAAGLARATTRRALITLEHLGYVAGEGRLFRLTPRVLDLGFACLSRLTLPQIAQPHLAWLAGQVHDSASMAVLAGDDIQYVARVPTVRIMSVDITPGTRFPAYATSMGRVLLAGLSPAGRAAFLARVDARPLTRRTVTSAKRLAAILDQTARDGYALVDQELEEGLRSVAVPVRDRAGAVVAAVNVSMHASRRTAEQARQTVVPPLCEAASRIERDLHVAGRFVRLPLG
ncbi:IclR family transcriptional regulator domain-containing protein [Sphaerisporangium perillae]|uniref:IclR family transcriptional regulator domain-containing protein n=1 Tax=Sphaerisporangium perillae TaxID=2935860 RepID=UPI00201023FE|nr:IclR family transcriptional regulator C-terminal domain-containing protein [Sphaerisporangium perillae]